MQSTFHDPKRQYLPRLRLQILCWKLFLNYLNLSACIFSSDLTRALTVHFTRLTHTGFQPQSHYYPLLPPPLLLLFLWLHGPSFLLLILPTSIYYLSCDPEGVNDPDPISRSLPGEEGEGTPSWSSSHILSPPPPPTPRSRK